MADIAETIDALNLNFNAFKEANDQRIAELEKGRDDSVLAETVEKLKANVGKLQKEADALNLEKASLEVGAGKKTDPEYNMAFLNHMRKGDVSAALEKGVDTDGGFLAPIEWDRTITKEITVASPMRAHCQVQTISGAGFKKLFNIGGTTSGWVGETDARPQTANSQFKQLEYVTGEIYANPFATQQLLDDSAIVLDSWLAGEVKQEIVTQEGEAFIAGDGANKPAGLLTYADGGVNASKHPFGAVEVKEVSYNYFTFGEYPIVDALIDLIYSLKAGYRQNAKFMVNSLVFSYTS